MYYMGIDLHKKYFVSTIMDKEGKILKRSRVSTDRESIKHYFSLLKNIRPVKAVIEATFNWVYFYDEISPFVDEAILAHLPRSGLIPKAYTPSFETRDLRLCV